MSGRKACKVALKYSNPDSTNEQTSWTVFFSVRYLRMDAICLIAERHKWLICCSIDRVFTAVQNRARAHT